MTVASPHCFMFDMHWMPFALSLALLNAGRSSAAKMAMMAMTTSNSISVDARLRASRPRGCLHGNEGAVFMPDTIHLMAGGGDGFF